MSTRCCLWFSAGRTCTICVGVLSCILINSAQLKAKFEAANVNLPIVDKDVAIVSSVDEIISSLESKVMDILSIVCCTLSGKFCWLLL